MRLRRTAATEDPDHTEHITVAEGHDEAPLEAETVAEHEDDGAEILTEEAHEPILAMPQLPEVTFEVHHMEEGVEETHGEVEAEGEMAAMEISTEQHDQAEMMHPEDQEAFPEGETTTDHDTTRRPRSKSSTARGRGGVRATKKPSDFADPKSYEEYMHRRTLNNEQCRIHRRRKKEELEKISHQVNRLTIELHEARVEIQGLKGELAATKSLLGQATKELNMLRGGGGDGVNVAGSGLNVVSLGDGVATEVEVNEESLQEQGGSGRTVAMGSSYVSIAAAPVYPSGPGYPPPGAWMKA